MSNQPDIDMKSSINKENINGNKKELEKNSFIYADYKKILVTMEKAANLKDIKSLYQLYNQINKFRINFDKKDLSFISEIILNSKLPTTNLRDNKLDDSAKEKLSVLFNFSSKSLSKIKEIPEVIVFNKLLLILCLIDDKSCEEAFDLLSKLIVEIMNYDLYTLSHLKAKTYYYLCLEAEKLNRLNTIIP